MSTTPVGLERRVGQRFAFHLPVSLRDIANGAEALGCTQNVSSRGAFLFTDLPVTEGSEIELTLKMPSEITLGESMHVRCRARILRVTGAAESLHAEMRFGVAVCLKAYEYLPEVADLQPYLSSSWPSRRRRSHCSPPGPCCPPPGIGLQPNQPVAPASAPDLRFRPNESFSTATP